MRCACVEILGMDSRHCALALVKAKRRLLNILGKLFLMKRCGGLANPLSYAGFLGTVRLKPYQGRCSIQRSKYQSYRLSHKLLYFLVKITSEYHKFGLVNYAILCR